MVECAIATVNGKSVTLREALSLALWRGDLRFMEEAMDARIVSDTAGQSGISVSHEELQEAADVFRVDHGLHEARAMHEWLAEQGRTVGEWQEFLEQGLLADKLRNALFDKQVEHYFTENEKDFDRAVISRIIVADEGLAAELWYRVFDDGEDFYTVARTHSTDAATRPSGGLLGPVGRKDLPPVVRAAVFAAHAGEVIGPIAVKEGWLLVKVEEHLPAFLDTDLRERIKRQLFDDWLREERGKAQVVRRFSEWV